VGTIIKSIEYYLPGKVVSNFDLHEENPDWEMDKVVGKTGVNLRHIAD
jgi:3-oxoacyl-[acyl-carrier-protein] synthase III